jgi:hypothetical protein
MSNPLGVDILSLPEVFSVLGTDYTVVVASGTTSKISISNLALSIALLGGTQLVRYTVGMPAAPPNPSLSAIAYDPNGMLPFMGWNSNTLSWK